MSTEPVLSAAAIAGLLNAAIVFARLMGWIALTDEQFNQLMVVVGLALPILAGLWARSQVTPTADPKTNSGEPLIPLSQAPAAAANPSAFARPD